MSTESDPIWDNSRESSAAVPLDEYINTGTANDPLVSSDETANVVVDGEPVTVEEGSTLLDAVEAADRDDDVPALCSYELDDNVGPRSECRTCMVETDEHGLVPSCSFPAEDGMTVSTEDESAKEARSVNLDLLLSDHNLRCTTCGQNGRCELQDVSIEQDVVEPRYGVFDEKSEYEPIDDSSPFIQIDRNKCILCNRCVEACNDVQVEGVLRMEGNAGEMRIAFQNGAETMMDSTCVSCGHCVTVCPTGALVEQGLTDSATLPFPGFNQKNTIGETIGEDYEHQPRQMTPMKQDRERHRRDPGTAEAETLPTREDD